MNSLEDEALRQINANFPCRHNQIQQLSALLSPSYPSPSAIVVHGVEATGKSTIVREVLSASNLNHAIIQSRECITGRHLFERTLTATLEAVETYHNEQIDRSHYTRCESLSTLSVQLQELLQGRDKFILVFDGVDNQRDAPPTLLPALVRLNETVPNLTVVLIVTFPRQGSFHRPGIPHIHFNPYTREEALRIVCHTPPSSTTSSHLDSEDTSWLWTRFCAALWDSLAQNAARDLTSFSRLAATLWPSFVAPVADGTFAPRDFSRLLVAKRSLFQNGDALLDKLQPAPSTSPKPAAHELPEPAKYLLVAAYLASYNPPRTDATFFMKYAAKKKRRRNAGTPGRPPKHRRIPRHHLAPAPFPLDRLLAIYASVAPPARQPTADLYTQLATLAALRLLVRSGGGGEGGDVLDPGQSRWRVNVGWEFVRGVGRSVGMEVEEWVAS